MAPQPLTVDRGLDTAQWRTLAEVAYRGICRMYSASSSALPYACRWNGSRATSRGQSGRYALISILGLARAKELTGSSDELVGRLWERVSRPAIQRGFTAGDVGLGLWANSICANASRVFTVDRAVSALRQGAGVLDSVELAWLLLGADHALLRGTNTVEAARLAREAKERLLGLYNPSTRLFFRHARRNPVYAVSRRVSCFANQVYPVKALALNARRSGCHEALEVAVAVAANLCALQGKLGQWWWLYDSRDGGIVDGYPVFSVHQDGMAPIALLELAGVCGRSYSTPIERGLGWVFGANEVGQDMVLGEPGLILRDIHLRGVGRVRRMIRGTLSCCGWEPRSPNCTPISGYQVNCECRPYHLGWVLYAAAMARQATGLINER